MIFHKKETEKNELVDRPDGNVLESIVQDEFEKYEWNFPVLLQTALIHEAHHLLVLREGQLDPEMFFWGRCSQADPNV